jgi:hypothetical protein
VKTQYYYLIVLLMFLVSLFVSFRINGQQDLIGPHENEYYLYSLLILHADSIESVVLNMCILSHKLIFLRSVPFMFLFGDSFLAFRLSSILLNLVLLMYLYHRLAQARGYYEGLLTLLVLFNSIIFVDMIISGYVDMSYILLTGIFLIEIAQVLETKDVPRHLFLLVALMLFAKTFSIPMFLVLFPSVGLVLLIKKRDAFVQFMIHAFIGIMIYFLFLNALSTGIHDSDLSSMLYPPESTLPGLGDMLIHVLSKSPFLFVNIALYLVVLYNMACRKDRAWTLIFLISELILFVVLNLTGRSFDYRLVFPFYIPYIVILVGFVSQKTDRWFRHIVLLCLMLLAVQSSIMMISGQRFSIMDLSYREYMIQAPDFLQAVPTDSKVHAFSSEGDGIEASDCFETMHGLSTGISTKFINYPNRMENPFIPKHVFTGLDEAEYVFCLDCSGHLGNSYTLVVSHPISNPNSMCDGQSVNIYKKG